MLLVVGHFLSVTPAAPLVQGSKVMQMYVGGPRVVRPSAASMPAAPSVKDLPAPTDPAVRLSVGGGELVAVAYFEGSITPASAEAARQQLIQALQAGERSRGVV